MLKKFIQAALGSEIDKNYNVESKPFATGGPNFCYRVYNGTRKSDGEQVSVFMFKDSYFAPEDAQYKEDFLSLLRQDAKAMSQQRHPCILKVLEIMPENKREVVFVTERVRCSLSNICHDFTNLPTECISQELKSYTLSTFEVSCGLMSLTEGIHFLHSVSSLIHCDINPQNIWLAHDGTWKVGGMGFSCVADTKCRWLLDCGPVNRQRYCAIPNWDYAAPEFTKNGGTASAASDLWSIGAIIWELFTLGSTSDGRITKLVDVSDGCASTHKEEVEDMGRVEVDKIPKELQATVHKYLSASAKSRGSLSLLQTCPLFSSGHVFTMKRLYSIMQMNEKEQREFLSELKTLIFPFPTHLLVSMVLPRLIEIANVSTFGPYVLPPLLFTCQYIDKVVFKRSVVPILIPLITLSSPPELVSEIYTCILSQFNFILDLSDEEFRSKYLLPMIGRSITCGIRSLQSRVLSMNDDIMVFFSKEDITESLLPRLQKLAVEGEVPSLRARALRNMSSLHKVLDAKVVVDEVLKSFKQVLGKEKDPDIVEAIIEGYVCMSGSLQPIDIAQNILPKVTYLLGNDNVNAQQFENLVASVESILHTLVELRRAQFGSSGSSSRVVVTGVSSSGSQVSTVKPYRASKEEPVQPSVKSSSQVDNNKSTTAPPPLPSKQVKPVRGKSPGKKSSEDSTEDLLSNMNPSKVNNAASSVDSSSMPDNQVTSSVHGASGENAPSSVDSDSIMDLPQKPVSSNPTNSTVSSSSSSSSSSIPPSVNTAPQSTSPSVPSKPKNTNSSLAAAMSASKKKSDEMSAFLGRPTAGSRQSPSGTSSLSTDELASMDPNKLTDAEVNILKNELFAKPTPKKKPAQKQNELFAGVFEG